MDDWTCLDCGSSNIGMNKDDDDDWACLNCDSTNLGGRGD